jgi:hypothetical protein
MQIPVSLKLVGSSDEACGFTQDLSARGTFFYTDFPLAVGERVELTLLMPAEITLTVSMRVCCQGTVLRVVQPAHGTKMGVAVHFAGYEYISEPRSDSATFNRISALHEKTTEDEPSATHASSRRSALT